MSSLDPPHLTDWIELNLLWATKSLPSLESPTPLSLTPNRAKEYHSECHTFDECGHEIGISGLEVHRAALLDAGLILVTALASAAARRAVDSPNLVLLMGYAPNR